MKNFDYYLPKAAAEASAVMAKVKDGAYKAGGTDLVTLMKEGLHVPAAVINLAGAAELAGVRRSDDGSMWIGAVTTIADLAEHAELRRLATAVAEAAERTATPLVRSKATLGGNLCQRPRCWYFRNRDYDCAKKGGDLCYTIDGENKYHAIFENTTCNIVHPSNLAPALWAFDAAIEVTKPDGTRRSIPIADFWVLPDEDISTENVLEPGELITGTTFTPAPQASGSSYIEVREKQSYDWALVCAAARVDVDGGKVVDLRLVASAVAPVPLRLEAAEAVVRGKKFSEELAWKAGDVAMQGATPLRDNGYKVKMLRACVAHALMTAHQRAAT